jgi:hypothetical protein
MKCRASGDAGRLRPVCTATSHGGGQWIDTGAVTPSSQKQSASVFFAINTSPLGCVGEFENFKVLKE